MRLFYLQTVPAQILSINVDGSDERVHLDLGQQLPDGLYLDTASTTLYWTDMGSGNYKTGVYPDDDGRIESIAFNGSSRKVLIGGGKITTPKQIVLDKYDRQWLYFCDREGMKVYRLRTDGSKIEELVSRGVRGHDQQDILRHCVGITTDAKYAYFTQKGPPKAGKGRIYRVPKDASGFDPSNRSDIEELAADLPEPIDLELATSGKLYWTDRGAPPNGNSVNVADITDQGLKDHRVIATGFKEAIGLAVTSDERFVYVTDLGGNIYKVDIKDGTKEAIRTGGRLTGIVLVDVNGDDVLSSKL